MKGLLLGNKILPADSIDSLEISMSPLTKNYQVLVRQGSSSVTLFSSNDQLSAQGVFEDLSKSLYEPIDVASQIVSSLEKTLVDVMVNGLNGKWVLSEDQRTLSKNKTLFVTKVDGGTLTLENGASVKIEKNATNGFDFKFGNGSATNVRITSNDLDNGYVEAKVESNTYNYKLMLSLPIPQDLITIDSDEEADLIPGRTLIKFDESVYAKSVYDNINKGKYIQDGYNVKTEDETVVVTKLDGLPLPVSSSSKIKCIISNDGKLAVGFDKESFVKCNIANENVGKHIQIDTSNVRFILKIDGIYVPQYTVDFYDNDSKLITKQVEKNDNWEIPRSELTKEGYNLEGVYRSKDLNINSKILERYIGVYKDMILYTKWVIKKLNVTFDVDGGTSIKKQTVSWGSKAKQPTSNPTKEGHTFAGYFKDSQKQTQFNFESEIIKNDTVIYVKWTPIQYDVTFNVDGGSEIPTQKVNFGGKVSKPQSDPTKAGHIFAGYFKDSDKSVPFDFDSEIIKSNTTIYVKWDVQPSTVSKTSFEKLV